MNTLCLNRIKPLFQSTNEINVDGHSLTKAASFTAASSPSSRTPSNTYTGVRKERNKEGLREEEVR